MSLFQNKIISEEDSLIQDAITKLIDRALKDRLIELAIDDVRLIAKELMPDIDLIVSKKVKQHFYEIGEFMVNKFKNVGE